MLRLICGWDHVFGRTLPALQKKCVRNPGSELRKTKTTCTLIVGRNLLLGLTGNKVNYKGSYGDYCSTEKVNGPQKAICQTLKLRLLSSSSNAVKHSFPRFKNGRDVVGFSFWAKPSLAGTLPAHSAKTSIRKAKRKPPKSHDREKGLERMALK